MSPAASPANPSLGVRVARLEEWRDLHEEDVRRREKQSMDFELRLRAVEAAQIRQAMRMAALATMGSALATVVVQVFLRVLG